MVGKRLSTIIGLICIVFTVVSVLVSIFWAKSKINNPGELKFAVSMPAGHPITTDAFEVWARRVESATLNRVKITVFPGDTLISPTTAYEAVKRGACDIAMLIQPYEPNRFPLTMVMNLPLDFPNAVVPSKVAWMIYQKFPEIQEEYKDVKLLFFYSTSPYQIHTAKKAIRKLKDFKGLLIRVGDQVDKAIVEALGGIPEFMYMPDSYLALSKGVIDAHMSPFGPMKGFRTAEVTRFHIENANLHTSIFGIIMNLKKWQKLPLEIRKRIQSVSGLEAAELFGNVFDRTDLDTIKFMKDKGDTFIHLSEGERREWQKSLDVIVKDWVKRVEALGKPGRQILKSVLQLKDIYTR